MFRAARTSRAAVARRAFVVLITLIGLVAVTAGPVGAVGRIRRGSRVIDGTVRANGAALRGATVRLLRAGATPGIAQTLDTTTSLATGAFALRIPPNVGKTDVLYVTARGGWIGTRTVARSVELATSLADLRSGAVVVNELTTVAAGYSLAQYASHGSLGGANPGLRNAAKMLRNLVDIATGTTTRFLAEQPNGSETETLASFNSLASIIAGCAAGSNDCDAFLDSATDAWGTRPATTWQAMSLLPTNPSGDAPGVFAQIPSDPRYEPVRDAPPTAWVLALRFYGNGRQFNGPGNVAFDADGRVWANNNAERSVRPQGVCPGLEMFLLDPYAPGRPMQTFYGGGLNGAGFGIGIDPRERVWVGNFGFTGSLCPDTPTSNSVSEFHPNGRPISGDAGWTTDR